MIDGLKPYPDYKESGLPWLGRLPRHWDTGPGFATFREKRVKNIGMQESKVLSLSYGRIVVKPPEKLHGLVPESFETYQIVDPGDIIIRSTDLQNDWTSLRVGLVRDRGIITSAYLCLKTTDKMMPEHGYLLLHAFDLMKVFYGMGSGLRQNLDFSDFKRMLVFVPPLDEQASIVQFLYHAIRRLNRAIRAKQRVIALLNEQKQVIIHRAVTRGLDPDAPLKPSGIPWLGDIPQHWEFVPLKSLCSIQSGVTLGKYYTGQNLTEYPYLRVANVQAGHLNLETVKSLWLPEDEAKRYLLRDGDVLMTEGGDPDKLGRGCVWEGQVSPCLHQNHIFAVRPDTKKLISKYLSAVLSSDYAKNYFLLSAKQTTNLASTNRSTIGRFHIPLPTLQEQDAILVDIEKSISPIFQTITNTERKITLLQEFRTSLIADVVTGKLDVRKAASRLPSEPDEVEPDIEAVEAIEEEFQESETMGEAYG